MAIGRQIELGFVTVEITAMTEDARPAEAAFHFSMDLQSPHFRWLQWSDEGYVPFAPPAVGETVTLPAPTIAF
jgi:hypothetical protein